MAWLAGWFMKLLTDTYIGGPPKPDYPRYLTRHADSPPTYPLDLNSPMCLRDYDNRQDNLDRTLEYIWRNDAGFTWSEIYLQLLGLWHYYAGINQERRDDILTCQLMALFHNYRSK